MPSWRARLEEAVIRNRKYLRAFTQCASNLDHAQLLSELRVHAHHVSFVCVQSGGDAPCVHKLLCKDLS